MTCVNIYIGITKIRTHKIDGFDSFNLLLTKEHLSDLIQR